MLFRPVVQRHVKRNAQDATVTAPSVAWSRQSGQAMMLVIIESLVVKRKILFLKEN
ncbi:hypothetical protein [Janthinobacterium tructae]